MRPVWLRCKKWLVGRLDPLNEFYRADLVDIDIERVAALHHISRSVTKMPGHTPISDRLLKFERLRVELAGILADVRMKGTNGATLALAVERALKRADP